jgi:hypothetical protein
MTGKVVDNNATGILVLILPLAITIVVVLKAWPFLLVLMALVIIGKIWQTYEWRKWTQEVNPFFTQLIKENQGCITPLDLSLKANLTAKAANRFLAKKAEEYGAQKKIYAERGVVYYFLTASALGSIFADSDQLFELEESDKSEPSPQLSTSSEKFPQLSTQEIADLGVEKQAAPVEEIKTETKIEPEIPSDSATVEEEDSSTTAPEEEQVEETLAVENETKEAPEMSPEESPPEANSDNDSPSQEQSSGPLALIQADLAKRLDINPSTVGRRKSDPDFSLWSQTKDPEGIGWKYVPKTKMFVPVDS